MLPSPSRRNNLRVDGVSEAKSLRAMSRFIPLCALAFAVGSISTRPFRLRRKNFIAGETMALVVGGFQPVKTREEWTGHAAKHEDDLSELYDHILEIQSENERLRKTLDKKKVMIDFLKKKLSVHQPVKSSNAQQMLLSRLAKSSNYVKEEVVTLIINEYTSPDSPDKKDTTLGSALEAIYFKETDGDPVPVNTFPFLFVGSVGASLNKDSLLRHNITHVVNWSNSARCYVVEGIEYLCLHGIRSREDMSRLESVDKLSDAVEFVERARLAGGKVMSHCWYGRNRSVTLLVAYLMKYAGMEINEATDLIAETRPEADPYVEALELYQKRYLFKDSEA
ncbi:hypothetical protein ACHAW6_003135 [Cyclotella cf. meneghiniana]